MLGRSVLMEIAIDRVLLVGDFRSGGSRNCRLKPPDIHYCSLRSLPRFGSSLVGLFPRNSANKLNFLPKLQGTIEKQLLLADVSTSSDNLAIVGRKRRLVAEIAILRRMKRLFGHCICIRGSRESLAHL